MHSILNVMYLFSCISLFLLVDLTVWSMTVEYRGVCNLQKGKAHVYMWDIKRAL